MSISILTDPCDKKKGIGLESNPLKRSQSTVNIPPTVFDILMSLASLLDDLQFHVISPPSLAQLGLPASLATSLVIRNISWIKPSANHQLPC